MLDWLNLHVLALVAVAAQFGGMGFFAFLFTPLVFHFNEREDASLFLRQVFPVYCRVNTGLAIVPALLLAPGQSYAVELVTMLSVAATFLISTRFIVPAAARARRARHAHCILRAARGRFRTAATRRAAQHRRKD